MAKKAFDVSDELKAKIESIIEASGMQQKEWIEAVTNMWIMQEIKNGLPDFQKDISELELHTNRINELYKWHLRLRVGCKDDRSLSVVLC